MADTTPFDIGDLYETKAKVVDIDLTRAIGTEPDVLSGHGAAEQAYRTCSDIISNTKKKLDWCREDKNLSEQAIAKQQAQIILQERKRLANVEKVCESLSENAKAHRLKFHPAIADDPTTSAALWPHLPGDSLKMAQAYRQALGEKDKPTDGRVLNAIETLTSLHENRIPEEELAELRDQRFNKEAPELYDQVGRATDIHGVIESTHNATEQFLAELGTVTKGEDGLPTFGPKAKESGMTVRE